MNAQDIRASVSRQADGLVKEGMSAMHTDEWIEKSIIENWIKHGDAIPEEVQMMMLMLLTVFELRRRESQAFGGAAA